MSKKANAGDGKKVEPAIQARVEEAVEKNGASKLSVHDKARLRKAELGKIIAYAKAKLAEEIGENEQTNEQGDLNRIIAKYSKPQKDLGTPTYSGRLLKILKGRIKIHENEIWSDHRFGRETMVGLLKDALLREKPALRLWTTFDEETGFYTVVGKGKEVPSAWPMDGLDRGWPKTRILPRDIKPEIEPALEPADSQSS